MVQFMSMQQEWAAIATYSLYLKLLRIYIFWGGPPLLPEDVMMCESDVTHDRILTPVSMTTQGKLYQPATFYHNYF